MRKPTGSGVEFCLVAQTKCPGSVTTIQERHLDAAMQFFPCSHSLKQPMTFTRLAWNLRLLPARVVNGEAGRQRLVNTHTHTISKGSTAPMLLASQWLSSGYI